MRKTLFALLCACMLTHSIFSQPIEYKISLSVTTTAATCQGNGEIHCSITYDPRLDIDQVRYFYIPLSGLDSIVETSLPDITHLRPGGYKIKVSALCNTGLSGENAFIILTDSLNDVVVGSAYEIPHSWMIYNIYAFSAPYGIVPSMTCQPTGKIQLKIQQGTFPYLVDVWKITSSDTFLYKSVTFDTNMYLGNNPSRYDFEDYYTIDSLDIGTYRILCSDGCGYHMPYLQVSVPKVKYYDSRDFHLLRNSSGTPESNNIITFKEIADTISHDGFNSDYYRQTKNGQNAYYYRFVNPTLRYGIYDTTSWTPMPTFELSTWLYDTLTKLNSYGDIWGREVLLQLQPECGDTLFSYPFTIFSHGNNYMYIGSKTTNSHVNQGYGDYCGSYNPTAEYDMINMDITPWHFTEYCSAIDSINCTQYYGYTKSGGISNPIIGVTYHSYITFPLKHNIINLSHDTLVSKGIMEGNNYQWVYHLLQERNFHHDKLLVEITDANDNPVFADTITYSSDTIHCAETSRYTRYYWDEWAGHNMEEYLCPADSHYVAIYQPTGYVGVMNINNESHYTYERDTIRLVESPGGNFYNFTAMPNTDGYWEVYRDNSDNHAVIGKSLLQRGSSRYLGFKMGDRNLLPGRYIWIVNRPCPQNDTIVMDLEYDLPHIEEYPKYVFDTTCTALNIIPIKGQYASGGMDMETFFQVYSGDTLTHTASAVRKNDTLSIGIPGTYKIGMYTLPRNDEVLLTKNPCFVHDTLIEWDNETIVLDYIYGHVCNEEDEEGFVRVRGKHGRKPYTYTLYSASGGSGTVIATNSTGIFDHVPVRFEQRVSVELTDACNAHFITDLTISDMDKIRKCWTGDNQNFVSMVLGDTCHLYGLSLGGVSYHWSGPNGFSCNERNATAVIQSEADAGVYRIAIEGGGCGVMRDSVVVLALDDTRPCPDAIDYDGNVYHAIRINGLCWTQTNLRSEHYSDGRPIDSVRTYEHPNFTPEEVVDIFGMLYYWAEAVDSAHTHVVDAAGHIQGICPEGWYLPTRAQYERLALWGAPALRSPDYWINGAGGTNETGFTALPAGFYSGYRKRFVNLLGETRFWSANPDNFSENPHYYTLNFYCSEMQTEEKDAQDAYSIRCILAE